MLRLLRRTSDFTRDAELVRLILKLLGCSMIKANVRKMLEPGVNAVPSLLRTLLRALSQNAGADIAHRYVLFVCKPLLFRTFCACRAPW